MNELERILKLAPEDRTEADLDFLIKHEDELTTEMKAQLEAETTELDNNIEEEFTADFVGKGLNQPKKVQAPTEMTKNIGKSIVRNFTSEVKDLGDGMMEAIISSETEDRHGEVIDMKGLDVKNYMKNPIISYLHDHSVPSIGRTHKLTKTKDGRLIAKFEWAIKNDLKAIHDKARLMYELYKEKFQFAFSIEFIPQEIDGNKYIKSEMVGFAPVVVPANPDALLLAKKKGLDKELLKTYNISNMNLAELIAKAEKDGVESLTLAEVKFIKEHKDDLTANQIKMLASIFEDEKGEDETSKSLKTIADSVKTLADDVAELKKSDPVKVKDIAGQGDPDNKNFNIVDGFKTFGNTRVATKYLNDKGEVGKELKFLYYVKGLQNKDFSAYLDIVGKAAMNTSGNVVIPPSEFLVEIERLEEEVGIAARFATVRRSTSGAGLKYVQGDDDLEVFDTAEAGVKKSTKLTYKEKLLAWKKFAGILPITDELSEDSAIDLWNDATARFARAYARKGDELVFTANLSGGNNKKGILHETGVNIVTGAGDSFAELTYDNLVDMIYGVPTASARNGQFYLNRTILPVIMKLKDSENRPLWLPSVRDGAPATILGRPYVETEVLPDITDDAAATPFMVYGDLKYSTLGERTDVQIKIFDTGSVYDPADQDDETPTSINLLTQDVQAMRAVKRMNAVVRFPEAFSVLKTAATS